MTVHKTKSEFHSVVFTRKADTTLVVNQQLEPEDEFKSLFDADKNSTILIQPPFLPLQLASICEQNNILKQCIHVMEVNIDGTGHTIEPVEEKKKEKRKEKPEASKKPDGGFPKPGEAVKKAEDDNDPEKKKLISFFKEPFPGMSFISIRRKLRVDLEEVGYGYLEAIRNVKNELVFVRYVKASTVRLLRLDEPVKVEKTVERDGVEYSAEIDVRERRFVQVVGQKRIYYKEFGSTRNLNRETGEWENGKTKLPLTMLASEIIPFIVDQDAKTPYGVPRWINNLPAALGSRKAEIYNLDFFDAGGVPPAMIIIQGGVMTPSVRAQLQAHLAQKNSAQRMAIVEITSSSGTLDQSSKVDVKVERFGDARSTDTQFKEYDSKCEERIRIAFRIPPIFLGKAADYNFATAVTAYMVAEEQVFQPERKEFDEIINHTIVRALGVKKYIFKSNPITLKNVDIQLKALELGKGLLDGEEFIAKLNEVSGLSMEYSEEAAEFAKQSAIAPQIQLAQMGAGPAGNKPPAKDEPPRPGANTGSPSGATGVKKADDDEDLKYLARQWVEMFVGEEAEGYSTQQRQSLVTKIERLDEDNREKLHDTISAIMYAEGHEVEGVSDIVGACVECLDKE